MADFPSTTSAYGVWSLREQRDAVRGGNWPVVVEYGFLETQDNGANLTTYTFPVSGYSAGTLVISVHAKFTSSSENTISSVTVGGNAATEAVQVSSAFSNNFVTGMYYIDLDSSFTGDIVVTFASAQIRASIGTFLLPPGYTPDFTDSDATSSTSNLTIGDVSEGYYIVASSSESNNAVSVTNSTEVYNFQSESSAFAECWGGFDLSSGSKAISVSAGDFNCAVAARFT